MTTAMRLLIVEQRREDVLVQLRTTPAHKPGVLEAALL